MNVVKIHTEYINLGQFLKYVGVINNGGEAKQWLLYNKIYINSDLESRRGRKIYPGDSVLIGKKKYLIENVSKSH